MRIKWILMGIYLLGNALSLLLFWLAIQVDTGIELQVSWLALALVILLPGGVVFFFSSQLEVRLRRIAKALQGIVRGNYSPSNLPEYTREMGIISREIYNLSQQVKESIQTQRQETQKLQAILKGMQEGVISLDHIGRILLLNHAAEKMFEVNQEEVHDKYFTELTFSTELEELVTSALEQSEHGNKEFSLNNKIIRGEVNPIHGEKGRSRGVVIVCYDITELRRLEQVRTEFVGNVSHELRTPLTSIKGFVETLIDGAAEAPELRERFLNIIHHETLRLQRLVDELLALSRIENTQHQQEETFSSLQEAYNKIRPVIEPYAKAKQI
ncbi:MAG: cell wall metabolism sensor histidine kinase WalK, partial [Desulfitobacterium sp.]|nr:cell wall metabolism sensor histidine kinase WalK [Desulfitobacterium sp.]